MRHPIFFALILISSISQAQNIQVDFHGIVQNDIFRENRILLKKDQPFDLTSIEMQKKEARYILTTNLGNISLKHADLNNVNFDKPSS